jgi:hypothetical protein
MKRLIIIGNILILLTIALQVFPLQTSSHFSQHPLTNEDLIKKIDVVLVKIFAEPFFKDEVFHFEKVIPKFHDHPVISDTFYILTSLENPADQYILAHPPNSEEWEILRPLAPHAYQFYQYPIDFSKLQSIINPFPPDKLYPCGIINWTDGFVYSRAMSQELLVQSTAGYNQNNVYKDRLDREREVEELARKIMFDLIMHIPVYDYLQVSDILIEDQDVCQNFYYQVNNAIVQLEPVYQRDLTFEIPCALPLYGEQSLAQSFTTVVNRLQQIEPQPDAHYEKRKYVKIIIDARGTDFQPSMFPKIFNPQQDLLLSMETLTPDQLSSIWYAHYTKDPFQFRHYIWTPDQPRMNGKYALYLSALEAGGEDKTNIIISEENFNKIIAVPHNMELLKQGELYIIVD